jgi:hypothetical protein
MRCLIVVLLILVPGVLPGQSRSRGSRRGTSPATAPAPYKGVTATFEGRVRDLDKKKIVIETDDKQLITIRLSGKTKFLKNDQTIKRTDIDMDSFVSVDASEDTDLSLLAVAVTADTGQKKKAEPK